MAFDVTSLPDDLQEWLRSEAIQLQKPADEIAVDVLRRHRDATEAWLSGRTTQRPATLSHTCPTCEQAVKEVVVRVTGVCPTHGIVPILCGNPECWCAKDDPEPLVCSACQAAAVLYQAMRGWSCLECGLQFSESERDQLRVAAKEYRVGDPYP